MYIWSVNKKVIFIKRLFSSKSSEIRVSIIENYKSCAALPPSHLFLLLLLRHLGFLLFERFPPQDKLVEAVLLDALLLLL